MLAHLVFYLFFVASRFTGLAHAYEKRGAAERYAEYTLPDMCFG